MIAVAVAAGLGLAPLALLEGSSALAASSSTGSPSSSLDLSNNPVLATDTNGYSIQEGGSNLSRVSVTDHVAAKWAARVTSTGATTRIREPREPVKQGETWTFASDVKARSGAKAQITVSWFNSNGSFLSWSGGSASAVSPTTWTRVGAALKVPTGAAVAETVVNVTGSAKSANVWVTQHDVRAPSSSPTSSPTTSPTSSPTTSPTSSPTTSPTSSPTTSPTSSPGTLTNLPPQAAGIIYGSASGAEPYAHPGGLVVAGRDNYQDQGFKDVSAAGGTVLIYLDTVIDNPYGRYHDMLINQSVCGPATTRWPGSPKANTWGYLSDFRVGSVLQQKLPCVLEKMVAENPHMAGWFADDVGSRSWFPGFSWDSWGSANQQAYREGAIALTQTFRDVANRHGLIFLVNGTWSGGSLAASGGGYPDASKTGNAIADGGFVEHHDGEIGFFGPYGCASQWATQSPVTKGKAFNYAVTNTAAGKNEYVDSNCYAYVNQQADYDSAPPWGSFHPTGLPSRVTQ